MAGGRTAGPLGGDGVGRGRGRRLRAAVAGLAILIVALAAFAWQGGDGGDGDGPLNAIAAAAERTQREPGGRAKAWVTVTLPDKPAPLSLAGETEFDAEAARSRTRMTMPDPETGDPVELQIIGDGTMVYLRSDAFDSLPDGREWIGFDFALGSDPGAPIPSDIDAKGELELLEAVAGEVRNLGRARIRGVATTGYRGTVSVSEQAEQLRENGQDDVADQIEESGGPVEVEVWIDAGGLVRRMRVVQSIPSESGGRELTTVTRMDFVEFGSIAEIEVPGSDEVFDVTSDLEDEIGASS